MGTGEPSGKSDEILGGGGGGCDGLKCYAVVDILLIASCYRNQNNHPLLGF